MTRSLYESCARGGAEERGRHGVLWDSDGTSPVSLSRGPGLCGRVGPPGRDGTTTHYGSDGVVQRNAIRQNSHQCAPRYRGGRRGAMEVKPHLLARPMANFDTRPWVGYGVPYQVIVKRDAAGRCGVWMLSN